MLWLIRAVKNETRKNIGDICANCESAKPKVFSSDVGWWKDFSGISSRWGLGVARWQADLPFPSLFSGGWVLEESCYLVIPLYYDYGNNFIIFIVKFSIYISEKKGRKYDTTSSLLCGTEFAFHCCCFTSVMKNY